MCRAWTYLRQLTGVIKANAALPRIHLSSQISLADAAIIVLFALGGLAGFPGFAKYSEIKTQIANLEQKSTWAVLLFAFNYLLIYRKIRKSYFSVWLARFHAFYVNAFATGACLILAKLSFMTSMTPLEATIAVESGLAAVYLIIQGWVDFKPDLRSLAYLSKEIDMAVTVVKKRPREMLTSADQKRISALCNKFTRDIDAILECTSDSDIHAKLNFEKDKVQCIAEAVKSPLSELQDALVRTQKDK
jgi:hypothetical protein